MLSRAPARAHLALPAGPEFLEALHQHKPADDGEQGDVGDHDDDIELAGGARGGEEPDAQPGPHEATHGQKGGEFYIESLAAEGGKTARRRGCHDLRHLARHGNGGRYPEKDQQRCHQKPATDSEQPGNEADSRAKPQQDEDADRHFGDG